MKEILNFQEHKASPLLRKDFLSKFLYKNGIHELERYPELTEYTSGSSRTLKGYEKSYFQLRRRIFNRLNNPRRKVSLNDWEVNLYYVLKELDFNTLTTVDVVDRMRNHPFHTIPEKSGVYFFFDHDGFCQYIGSTFDFRSRLRNYYSHYGIDFIERKMNSYQIKFIEIDEAEKVYRFTEDMAISMFMPFINRRTSAPGVLWLENYLGNPEADISRYLNKLTSPLL
jgi:hypothetical protein